MPCTSTHNSYVRMLNRKESTKRSFRDLYTANCMCSKMASTHKTKTQPSIRFCCVRGVRGKKCMAKAATSVREEDMEPMYNFRISSFQSHTILFRSIAHFAFVSSNIFERPFSLVFLFSTLLPLHSIWCCLCFDTFMLRLWY